MIATIIGGLYSQYTRVVDVLVHIDIKGCIIFQATFIYWLQYWAVARPSNYPFYKFIHCLESFDVDYFHCELFYMIRVCAISLSFKLFSSTINALREV